MRKGKLEMSSCSFKTSEINGLIVGRAVTDILGLFFHLCTFTAFSLFSFFSILVYLYISAAKNNCTIRDLISFVYSCMQMYRMRKDRIA